MKRDAGFINVVFYAESLDAGFIKTRRRFLYGL